MSQIISTERMERLADAILQVGSRLEATSLPERLELIVKKAAEVLDAEMCAVLLVKQHGFLSLEASYGHREGTFVKGKLFEIRSGPASGLTGHIAFEGKLFNARGEALINHFAVRGDEPECSPSAGCYSLLAVPLARKTESGEELIGLLRASNKKNARGDATSSRFTIEDEEVLTKFSEAVVAVIENAELVDELKASKDLVARLWTSSPIGICSIDVRGQVTAFNEQAEAITGYQAEWVNGRDIESLYADSAEARRIGKLLHFSHEHRFLHELSTLRSRKGETIPIRLSATWLYGKDGNRIGSVGYFEDIRKDEEAGRRQALLLAASNVIARAETIEAGLESLAEMVVSLLDSTFARILLIDESQKLLEPMAATMNVNLATEVTWQPRVSEPIRIESWLGLDSILNRGKPVVLRWEEARSNLETLSSELELSPPIKSLLMIPLKIGNRIIGLLEVGETRSLDRTNFSDESVELAEAIAAQASVLIDHRRQLEIVELRKQLLTKLDEALQHIVTEKEPLKLQQEIARLAAEMFGFESAGLFINRPHIKELEMCGVFKLPQGLMGKRLFYSENGLLTQVAQTGVAKIAHFNAGLTDFEGPFQMLNFVTSVAVPLKVAGEISWVLLLGDNAARRLVGEADIEILQRFAGRSAIAMQTAQLMNREQRVFDRLAIVYRITQYLQEKQQRSDIMDKILHVVLTGVTAHYGLGFNRAVLLFREPEGLELVGRMGIGQFGETEARAGWVASQNEELWDFGDYLRRLEKDDVPTTPVGEKIKGFRIPIGPADADAFSRAVQTRECVLVGAAELATVPHAFREMLQPETDVAIVPLVAREQVIGLLVVDNKFTMAPITHSDIEALLAFASTVAIAIDNIRLFNQTEAARETLRSLYEASNTLVSAHDPRQILRRIVEQTREAAGARYVRLILIDEMNRAYTLVTSGAAPNIGADDFVRPDGITRRVLAENTPEIIDDKVRHPQSINPVLMRDDAMAALCLPLSLHEQKIGVLWIHFAEPRHFPDFEVDAFQLYANQAAIAYDSARRMEELEHMRAAAQELASASTTQEVLEQIVRSAREVLRADSAAVWSYDPVRDVFIPDSSVADGISVSTWNESWRAEPRLGGTAYTLISKGYLGIEEVDNADEYPYLGQTTRALLNSIGVKSFQGMVLKVGEEAKDRLGVLYANYNRYRVFSDEERRTAETLANHAAAALNKARLREQLEKARNAARVVAEVTALEKLPETLTLIASKTREAVHGDCVTLYTYDWGRDRFQSPPAMDGVVHTTEMMNEVGRDSSVYKVLAQNELHFAEDSKTDPLMRGAFVEREMIASSVGVPLIVRGRKMGVMFVNYRQRHRFTADELTNIQLFANQSAVAVRNSELYDEADDRASALEALYQAAQVVSASLDTNQILREIAKQAFNLTRGKQVKFVHIRMLNGSKAKLVAAYPEEELSEEHQVKRLEIDLDKGINGRIGILGRAYKTRQSQVVGDVNSDPDYIETNHETRSELVVLLKSGSEVNGLINVEHGDYNAFDREDQRVLEALAAQASIAIQNAEQYEEIKRTKGLVGTRTALAWMGMVSASWRHAIEGNAITIFEEAGLLQKVLQPECSKYSDSLDRIRKLARMIFDRPITPSLSDREGLRPTALDSFVKERLEQLWEQSPYKPVTLHLQLGLPAEFAVRISPEWFRSALDILIENAVEAVAESRVSEIIVATRLIEHGVEIAVSDTGRGIPPDIRRNLFLTQISASGRLGVGLLLAQTILQAYGGDVSLESTGSSGTTMVIRLPIESGVSFARDADTAGVFDIVRMNRELEKAYEELKELDKKKTEFLSTLSHELSSPLTPVRGCIENLLDGLYGPVNAKQTDRLRLALESVREEDRLIKNLLDLVRIQEGKETLDLDQCDVGKIISVVVSTFEYDAEKKNVELTRDVTEDTSLLALIDGAKVKAVITNLLSNAIKFTPAGGKIVVGAVRRNERIEVHVRDTGIGIPKEEHLKVFDWFYQVDSSLTRKVGGTGIGLNIVKRYVEMHGGHVIIDSEPLNGSTFTFTLPDRSE